MFDFFGIMKKEDKSKNVAKERLQMVLVKDRTNCSPELLELLREDILSSISDHVDFDISNLDIKITTGRDSKDGKPILVANIPINKMKR